MVAETRYGNRYGSGFDGSKKEEEKFLLEPAEEVYVVEARVEFAWVSGQYATPRPEDVFDELDEPKHVFQNFENGANGNYSWIEQDEEFKQFVRRTTKVHIMEFEARFEDGRLKVSGSLDVDCQITANDPTDAIELFKTAVELTRQKACGDCVVEVVT